MQGGYTDALRQLRGARGRLRQRPNPDCAFCANCKPCAVCFESADDGGGGGGGRPHIVGGVARVRPTPSSPRRSPACRRACSPYAFVAPPQRASCPGRARSGGICDDGPRGRLCRRHGVRGGARRGPRRAVCVAAAGVGAGGARAHHSAAAAARAPTTCSGSREVRGDVRDERDRDAVHVRRRPPRDCAARRVPRAGGGGARGTVLHAEGRVRSLRLWRRRRRRRRGLAPCAPHSSSARAAPPSALRPS